MANASMDKSPAILDPNAEPECRWLQKNRPAIEAIGASRHRIVGPEESSRP
jgi:hypothetical protein